MVKIVVEILNKMILNTIVVMRIGLIHKIFLISVFLLAKHAVAATYYEAGVGVHSYDLEISPRNAPEVAIDDSQSINISLAAYRKSSERSAWGAVIEINTPQGRDETLPGSGKILGFRPVNFQYVVTRYFIIELYGGVAQYDWAKNANGYYFGTSVRYQFGNKSRFALAFDGKLYKELAYDSSQGDDFVNGFNPGVKLFYRF